MLTVAPASAPLQIGDTLFESVQALAGSVATAVVGLSFLYVWWYLDRTRRLVADTPTEQVRSVAAGRTEVTGTAVADGAPLSRPFTEGEAVAADWTVAEFDTDSVGNWSTVAKGTVAEPFLVADDTGRIRVAADETVDLRVSDANVTETKVSGSDPEPPRIRSFLAESTDVDVPADGPVFDGMHKFTEEVLPPDSFVYAFGAARPGDGTDDQPLVLGSDDQAGRFLLSDVDEDALIDSLGEHNRWVVGIGVACLAFAFYLLLVAIGVA